ncbi:flavin containing amine oxidoreductase domain-containing protein [Sarocladium implicatum]|nr:flavin containing amine oxidoreductase domain-containing protein [Sarocladium implicatum]
MGLGHTLLVVATAISLAVGAAVAGREYGTAPVCIVGAGPSGLTAAKALENKGREVVIFEKRPDVGGKCQSHYKDGDFYPLGAVLFTNTPGYADTYELVESTGVSFQVVKPTEQWAYNPVTGSAQLTTTSPEQALQLRTELARYTELWQSLAPTFSAPAYQDGVPAELAVPARDWFLANNLTAIAAFVNRAWGDFGYGPVTEVPALYILRSAQPDILASTLSTTGLLTVDYHEVFTRFAKTIKGPFHLETQIVDIDRSNEKRPRISYRQKGERSVRTQQCSYVILAFPPAISALSKANLRLTSAEKDLFSNVLTNSYFASAVKMDHLSRNVSLRHVLPNPITPYETEGQPVYLARIHSDTDILTVWSMDERGQSDSVQAARGFLPEVLSKLNRNLSDSAQQGQEVTNRDVLAFSGDVDYFPHIGTEALLDGWYEKYNKLQGQKRTYYVSGVDQFEFVEYAIRAAEALVNDHF